MQGADDLRVVGLRRYLVKGCAGEALQGAFCGARGLMHDREWMIVDAEGVQITQRDDARLCLVHPKLLDGGVLQLSAVHAGQVLVKPEQVGPPCTAYVWKTPCNAVDQGQAVAQWLTDCLERPCRLVRMAAGFHRRLNADCVPEGGETGFADGYPFLMLSIASLRELHRRLPVDDKISLRDLALRFRPNILVDGDMEAHAEDTWHRFAMGEMSFRNVKLCDRCAVPQIDPHTGTRGSQPAAALAQYRRWDGKVWFGVNLVHTHEGPITVGNPIQILSTNVVPRTEA